MANDIFTSNIAARASVAKLSCVHIAFFRLQLSGNCVVPSEEGKTEGEPEHHLCYNLSNIIFLKPLRAAYRKACTPIVTGVISIEVSIVLC